MRAAAAACFDFWKSCGFRSAESEGYSELLALIEDAARLPKSEWPVPYKQPKEAPMSRIMLDILSAVTRATCEEQGVSHELVCTTQRLRGCWTIAPA